MKKIPQVEIRPIEILSIYALNDRIAENRRIYSHCISINDPNENMVKLDPDNNFKNILELSFHDINDISEMPIDQNPKPPNKFIIRSIVRFFKNTSFEANGYTIHCHAGVHRSVAAGFIGLFLMHRDRQYAIDELIRIKALPLPNRRMISLFDMMYDVDLTSVTMDLYERCRGFLDDRININQDDYLEELDPIED